MTQQGEKHPQHELNELFLQRELDLIITYGEFAPTEPGLKKIRIDLMLCKIDGKVFLFHDPEPPLFPTAEAPDPFHHRDLRFFVKPG